MTTLDPEITIAELLTQRPARSRVFEKLGIDYCCGGKRPLSEACREKGLEPQTVVRMLEAFDESAAGAGQTDWARATLGELIDNIEQTHHAYLRSELPRLQAMVRKVAAVHGHAHAWLLELEGVFAGFVGELESHMLKEEQMVFPMIRQIEQSQPLDAQAFAGSLAEPVQAMEHEHDSAGNGLERMRALSSDFTPPAGACGTFMAMLDGLRELEADMHQHVHKENNVLFPRALEQERVLKGQGGA